MSLLAMVGAPYKQQSSVSHEASTSTSSLPHVSRNETEDDDDAGGKKKKNGKRRKVNHACVFCRRSHMTCDEGRPCQRWCVPVAFNSS